MIYTVILNSSNLVNGNFFFDWSVIKDSKYIVTFTLLSTSVNLSQFSQLPMLYIDLGQSSTYMSSINSINANTSQFVGTLYPNFLSNPTFLITNQQETPPLYLNSRPTNNNFGVRLQNQTGTTWTDNSNITPNFILTLSFSSIDI